jgi:hypothetical protein
LFERAYGPNSRATRLPACIDCWLVLLSCCCCACRTAGCSRLVCVWRVWLPALPSVCNRLAASGAGALPAASVPVASSPARTAHTSSKHVCSAACTQRVGPHNARWRRLGARLSAAWCGVWQARLRLPHAWSSGCCSAHSTPQPTLRTFTACRHCRLSCGRNTGGAVLEWGRGPCVWAVSAAIRAKLVTGRSQPRAAPARRGPSSDPAPLATSLAQTGAQATARRPGVFRRSALTASSMSALPAFLPVRSSVACFLVSMAAWSLAGEVCCFWSRNIAAAASPSPVRNRAPQSRLLCPVNAAGCAWPRQ